MSLQRVQAIPAAQLRPADELASPPPPASGPLGSGGSEQPIFRLNLLRALQMHRRMALGFALGGLLLAVAYVIKAWPVYIATSQIYVQPVQTKVMASGPDSSMTSNSAAYDSFVQQQVTSATNPDVLLNALHKMKSGSWQRRGESEQAAAARLGGAIEVARVATSYEVAIAAKAKDPQLVAQIANAVAASVVERASGEGNAGNAQRITVLREERDRIQNELNSDYAEQDSLNKQLGMAAVGTEAPDLIDADIGRTREELIKAQTDHDEAEAKFVAMGAGKGDSSTAIDAEADDLVAADAGLTSMKTSLNARRATLITQMSNLTTSNPEYKQDAAELAKINGSLDAMMNDLRAKAAARIQQRLRTDLERTAGVEARLNGQLRQLAGSAASATPKLQRANDLAVDINRLRLRYTSVDEQLHNLMLEDSAPGAVHQSVVAVPPLHATVSGILKKAVPCVLAGLLLGLLAASLANQLDSKIYIAADIEQAMGFAPMAVLPDFNEVSEEVSAEHLLRLSASIEHARKQGNLNNCIFTGTSSGVGVTTLVARTRDILKAMGRPTVLLDSSGTPPPVPRASSSADQRGSRSTALLRQVAAETQLEQENLVLTDTAPLLISAETEYLARFVDCAIVVVESGVTTRAQMLAAATTLQRLEVASVGFVLNRVRLAKADPGFRESVVEIEKHHRAQSMSSSRRTERTNPLGQEPPSGAKELARESGVASKAEAAGTKSAGKPQVHPPTPVASSWSTAAPIKPWLPQAPKPAGPQTEPETPWWLSDAGPAPNVSSPTEKPKEPQAPAPNKTEMHGRLIPVQSWDHPTAWTDDFTHLKEAHAAAAASNEPAPQVHEGPVPVAHVRPEPFAAEEIAPKGTERVAPTVFEEPAAVVVPEAERRVAEKVVPIAIHEPAPAVTEEASSQVEAAAPTIVVPEPVRAAVEDVKTPVVAEAAKAQVALEDLKQHVAVEEAKPLFVVEDVTAPVIADDVKSQVVEEVASVAVPEPAPVVAEEIAPMVEAQSSPIVFPEPATAVAAEAIKTEAQAHAEEPVAVQAASKLNPLRSLMFTLGLKNLNRLKHGEAMQVAAAEPVEAVSDRAVIERALPQFAEPVELESAPVVVAVASEPAPVPEPMREVKALPEFLPPKEFVPVEEKEAAPVTAPVSRYEREDDFDGIRTLPSRRGQYKRRG